MINGKKVFGLCGSRRLLIGGMMLFSIGWAIAVLSLGRTLPVRLVFENAAEGSISLVAVAADGHETESDPVDLVKGPIPFSLLRGQRSFRFRFHTTERGACLGLKGIGFWGMNVLAADQIARFQIGPGPLCEPPRALGDAVVLKVKDGDQFDLPNVFPACCHMYDQSVRAVAFLPSVFCVLALLVALCWRPCLTLFRIMANAKGMYTVFLLVVLAFTLPTPIVTAKPGLDPSWEWLFSRFAFTGAIGPEMVFTYGPLGFLIAPQLTLTNVLCGMCVNLLFIGTFGCVLLSLQRSVRVAGDGVVLFGLPLIWLLAWPNGMEWKWCAVSMTVVGYVVFRFERIKLNAAVFLLLLAAAMAVVQAFVKFSSCIAVLAQHAVLLLYLVLRKRRSSWPCVVAYVSCFFFLFCVFALALFPSFSAFADWVIGSMEVARGYNLYMCSDKTRLELVMPFVYLIALALCVGLTGRDRFRSVAYWAVWSPLLFCLYKYAVVRQSVVPLAFLMAWLLVMWNFVAVGASFRSMLLAAMGLLVATLVEVVFYGKSSWTDVSYENLRDTLCPQAALTRAVKHTQESVSPFRLPSEWLADIGTNRVMIIGCEMAPAMSGDVNLTPFPATQIYSAYTPYLDCMCARRLEQDVDKVRFVIVPDEPKSFDARNLVLDNPRLWDVILRYYLYKNRKNGLVLMERVPHARPKAESSGFRFRFRRSLWGKVKSFLFRPDRALISLTLSDGTSYCSSINPEVLEGCYVPSAIPVDASDFVEMLADRKNMRHRVSGIRLILPEDEVTGCIHENSNVR